MARRRHATRLLAAILGPAIALALGAAAAQADMRRYALEAEGSTVGFTYTAEGRSWEGSMPVERAEIGIDFDDVRRTEARVTLDASGARAGFIFATQAMKSPAVLDTQRHPTIAFRSTRVTPGGSGAVMEGDLTIRGVTRPVRLSARFARAPGAAPGDLERLTILLTGAIDRTDFGATGYPGQVGDRIGLRILAAIRRLD